MDLVVHRMDRVRTQVGISIFCAVLKLFYLLLEPAPLAVPLVSLSSRLGLCITPLFSHAAYRTRSGVSSSSSAL